MEFLAQYGTFLAETLTIVLAIIFTVAVVTAIAAKDKNKANGKIKIKNTNDKYQEMADILNEEILDKKQRKALKKQQKADAKKRDASDRKRVFILTFKGDLRASAVESLREEVSAIITVAKPTDEVLIRVESPGGMVSTYGLAASQMQRLRDHNIPLTVAVDKVAASGGYLMACVANKILAAPFAIIGSIGVVMQLPNFNRFLKKHDIDFEMLTAGEYKRTLTTFGENTDKARKKTLEDLELIHNQFKDYISEHRPQVNLEKAATGEYWLAKKAYELRLVDHLQTSDDYLLDQRNKADLYEVQFSLPQSPLQKFMHQAKAFMYQSNGLV